MHRFYFLVVFAFLAATFIVDCKIVFAEQSKPNIIFFLVDDLGWQDTSVAFGNKATPFQDHFRTPNVELLAKQGVRFTNAYSCAVCSPTRTSIMTGQNAARHRVTNWTLHPNKDQSSRTNRIAAPENWNLRGLQPDQVTIATVLQAAGYTTIHCGKAHWGTFETDGADPTNLGFDVNIAGHPAGAPGSYSGLNNFGNHPDGKPKPPWGVPGLEKYHGTNTFLTDALANEACSAVERAIDNDKPFFLYMAPYAVHTPIQPNQRFIPNYDGKTYSGTNRKIPKAEARYASMVEGYDAALGQLLQTLERKKCAENTVVVFTSDNGGLSVHARGTNAVGKGRNFHNWPLREGKGSAYEGGTRVPLVVSWAKPNQKNAIQESLPIQTDSISSDPVICDDFFPTLCSIAKVETANLKTNLDGIDITPAITQKTSLDSRPLIFHYPHVWGPRGEGYQPHSAIRMDHHKLIYFYHSRRCELYDLSNDIGEKHNLANEKPDLAKTLTSQLFSSLKKMSAQFPKELYQRDSPFKFQSHSAIAPVASKEDRAIAAGWKAGSNWLEQHHDINSIAKQGNVDVAFFGDSITQNWGGQGRNVGEPASEIWDQYYSKRNAANFGISGDRTQNILWRIQNGNMDGLSPSLVVLHIGTNNLAHNTSDEIADGIQQIVFRLEELRRIKTILIVGILPRGKMSSDPLRSKIEDINQQISKLASEPQTFFVDIGNRFLNEDKSAKPSHYAGDFLHLSIEGYQEFANAIEPTVTALLTEK